MGGSSGTKSSAASGSSQLYGLVWFGAAVYAAGIVVHNAYKIRMGAIEEFGPVIHEFDPYFNFRATEVRYLPGIAISIRRSLL